MKRKTFLTTLFLFLLLFNAAIFLVTVVTFQDRFRMQKERGLAEHYVLMTSVLKDMQALEARGADWEAAGGELAESASRMVPDGEIALTLFKGNSVVYSEEQIRPEPMPEAVTGTERYVKVEQRERNQEAYENDAPAGESSGRGGQARENGSRLLIYGRFPEPYQEYTLVYSSGLEKMLAEWEGLKNTLYGCGLLFSVLLALGLLLLLERIFRPLKQIAEASSDIAAGNYGRKLPVPGRRDELDEMAASFNHMSDEISRKIEELDETAKQKQRFIDDFAHELRTPLTAVYGYAEYLRNAVVSEDDKLAATSYIMSECRRLQDMAGQLLELAMLREEEVPSGKVAVDGLFAAVRETAAYRAREKGVRLAWKAELEELEGDEGYLEILLLNLIDNAVKACREGGNVEIKAYRRGKRKAICITDDGRGMNAEELAHIKEAFYRADKARSREEGGAGLGLSICDRIVKLHGGKLIFHSEPGKGTRAEVIFTTS